MSTTTTPRTISPAAAVLGALYLTAGHDDDAWLLSAGFPVTPATPAETAAHAAWTDELLAGLADDLQHAAALTRQRALAGSRWS